MKPLVTIVDEVLPSREFATLSRAIEALGTERLRSSYQTTFWFDFETRPASLVEAAALRCLKHLPPARRRGVIGVEWWLSRMRTSNVKVDFHLDRDNALFEETGETVSPRTGSVLYLTRSVGGLLAVTREEANPKNLACAPDEHDFDLAEPTPNRFVYFDGALTHGVLDAKNEIPGARLPTVRSWRVGIAINFWHRRPLRVPTFSETGHYRLLALRRRSE